MTSTLRVNLCGKMGKVSQVAKTVVEIVQTALGHEGQFSALNNLCQLTSNVSHTDLWGKQGRESITGRGL